MIAIRLRTLLLISALAAAQQVSSPTSAGSNILEPKLPVIDDKACPGPGRIVPKWKIQRDDRIYSSWRDKRNVVGTLKRGESVTVLAGINVIREPGRALIKQSGADSLEQQERVSLKPGDAVLLYGYHANGDYDLWAKGVWFTRSHEEIAGKGDVCGFADKSQCIIVVTKTGVRDWWVKVKTGSSRTGWVLAYTSTGDHSWDNDNFNELCGD